jgi:hypothetical protein
MIQHRIAPPPPPPSWAPRGQRRFPAPPAAPRPAPLIPGPRPAPVLAPAGVHPYPGPPVPEVRIRPRLLWVGLSWLLFGVLVLAGVATFVAEALGSDAGAGPHRFFGSGEVATLELDPDAEPLVYAALDAGGSVTCRPVGPAADRLLLTPTATDWSVVVDGREWHAAFHLSPVAAGTYQIRCDGAGASFGMGDRSDTAAVGGAALALVVLPLVGLATAVSTTIMVLARRRAAQDRLLAPWTGAPSWPAQRW